MSYECPRCGTTLVETDDVVNDYELEGCDTQSSGARRRRPSCRPGFAPHKKKSRAAK